METALCKALAKVFLLKLPKWKWQTPRLSSPSTVASRGPRVRIRLSDDPTLLFYDVFFVR